MNTALNVSDDCACLDLVIPDSIITKFYAGI